MNRRFVKFLTALALCLLGLSFLAANALSREMIVIPFGMHVPSVFVFVGGLGVILAGVRLAQHAILEELSVTSD